MSDKLIFDELSVKNFMSYGNSPSIFQLNDQGTVTISGENMDIGGSNGSGKTVFLNALCYVIYNKPFDNITLQRLVNNTNGLKNTLMEVKLFFRRGEVKYEITRSRGAEYNIAILRDGEDITPGKSAAECDALLETIIGFSYEIFTKTIIFSGNSIAFLQQAIAAQRQQFEELFNISLLSEKAKVLKEKIKTTEQDIKIVEAVVVQQENAIDLHEKHLNSAEERIKKWDQDRERSILAIEKSLELLGKVDIETEKLLHNELDSLKRQVLIISNQLAAARKDHRQISERIKELSNEHKHLEESRCPYCSQPFANADEKLAEIEADLMGQLSAGDEIAAAVKNLEAEELGLNEAIKEILSAITHQNIDSLIKLNEESAILVQKLADLKVAENPHIDAFSQLKAEVIVQADYSKLDVLKRRLDHQQFLLKLLTDKNSFLRQKIINKTIPFLNKRINFFTSSLGLPHTVKFDVDMSCTVSEFGRELDFGNLSAGEKKRVNTALSLAFRDVLHHLHASTNLLIIDELDGGLDGQGLDGVIRCVKEKSRDDGTSIFVISHHPNITGRLDKNIIVRKEHGFSSVIYE